MTMNMELWLASQISNWSWLIASFVYLVDVIGSWLLPLNVDLEI